MNPGFIFAMPTRATICTETFLSLAYNSTEAFQHRAVTLVTIRQFVDDARNNLVAAIKETVNNDPSLEWFVIWADSDAFWPPETIGKMHAILDRRKDIDILAAYYSPRATEHACAAVVTRQPEERHLVVDGKKIRKGAIVKVAAVGFHFVMHRASVLKRLPANPFTIAGKGISEDWSFCDRATRAGATIYCATDIPVGHVDERDGAIYYPAVTKPARLVAGSATLREASLEECDTSLFYDDREYISPLRQREFERRAWGDSWG